MEPRGIASLDEGFGVLMGILLLHGGEARDAQVWKVLAVRAGVGGQLLIRHVYFLLTVLSQKGEKDA